MIAQNDTFDKSILKIFENISKNNSQAEILMAISTGKELKIILASIGMITIIGTSYTVIVRKDMRIEHN